MEDSEPWRFLLLCSEFTDLTQVWQKALDVGSGPVSLNRPDPPEKYVNSHCVCSSSAPPKCGRSPFLDGLVDTPIQANERNKI